MKIAVCSLAIGVEFKNAVYYSQKTKKLYCEKHSYDYIDDDSVYDVTRPPAWSKILLILKYLDNYDYLVWIDADAMIMDDSQKLEDKIQLMGTKDIMCIEHYKDINTGVLFVKNTEFSRSFFERLYAKTEFINSPNWEQDAFITMLNDTKDHVEILHLRYERQIQDYWFSFRPGESFILHYAGYRGRCAKLKEDVMRDCPLRLDTEDLETFQKRMDWHKNCYRNYVDKMLEKYLKA